ncbi:hypothetical protein CLF47_03900 [Salmonella enterica subsp. enterica serovar Kottbus]|nr:hypothetical protein [Salmonella enterica subsp. enterica serovar Kottbus]
MKRPCHKNSSSRMSLCQGYFRNLYRLCGGTEGKLTNASYDRRHNGAYPARAGNTDTARFR